MLQEKLSFLICWHQQQLWGGLNRKQHRHQADKQKRLVKSNDTNKEGQDK